MFYVKIDNKIQEFIFDKKVDALMFIIDFLDRKEFGDPKTILKNCKNTKEEYSDTLITNDYIFTIFVMFYYHKCCVCADPITSNLKLDCGHYVCTECLKRIRKPECPLCRSHLSGKIVSDEIYANILHNVEVDIVEEEDRNEAMALLSVLGINVNELY